jgi:DNA-binding response OmpR family regulator
MKKVLIVDDDESILEALKIAIETEGYSVEIQSSGENVVTHASTYCPNLILLDFLLSGMDGSTILQELKNNKDTDKIPVIMISAHPHAGKSASDAGADGFLPKPFDLEELLSVVAKYIS